MIDKAEIKEPGLREKKAAKITMTLLESLTERLSEQDFKDIRVEDLCEDAMISKVTFFKYFPTKEDLLDLYFSFLIAYQNISIRRDKLRGLAALRRLFENMGKKLDESPVLFQRVFAFIAQHSNQRRIRNLTLAELIYLFPGEKDLQEIESNSMGKIMIVNTRIAFEQKELKPVINEDAFIALISSLFNGTGIAALRVEKKHPGKHYLINFDNLIKVINQ